MSKIGIITDSTSDLPEDLVEKYDIKSIPLSVIFKEETFLDDGKEITVKEFYKKLRSTDKLPTTTQPTPKDFIDVYKDMLNKYDSIISIHISKKMSGTINSAEMAKQQMPHADITIIDSECVHMPLGFLALEAAKLAKMDSSKEDILEEVKTLKGKIKELFVPSTLEYLRKGGRIGKAKGLIASLLDIKPILAIHDGEVSQFKTTRRWNQAKTELINSMDSMIENPEKLIVSIGDSDAEEDGIEMLNRITEKFSPKEIFRVDVGTVVGTHLGAGGIAISFYEE
ncbi:MAG TPA: DegV family protein [Actinobacteria bacterium]|nr:DegV family protein [Actinomycetota bacterium]